MDYGLWTAHGSLSATIGASIAALCCATVMLGTGQGRLSEWLGRPAMLLCLMMAIAVAIMAIAAVPSVAADDLARALVMGWGIVFAHRLRAQLGRFTRETWWSPSP